MDQRMLTNEPGLIIWQRLDNFIMWWRTYIILADFLFLGGRWRAVFGRRGGGVGFGPDRYRCLDSSSSKHPSCFTRLTDRGRRRSAPKARAKLPEGGGRVVVVAVGWEKRAKEKEGRRLYLTYATATLPTKERAAGTRDPVSIHAVDTVF